MIDSDQTKLPYKKLIGAYTLLFCEAINTTSFFTYVGFMIVHFNITTEENVGYYSGFVASSFSIAQFCSSFFWGYLSDKYGRKPILLIGALGSVISGIGIGFSRTLPILIFTRSLNGILNGNIGVVKTYIGEVTNKHNQIEAFGWVGLTWGLGSILGPLIGGLFIYPATKLPSLFGKSQLLIDYPFLLPNLVIGLSTLSGLIFTYFYMKETLKNQKSSIQLTETNINSQSTATTIKSNQTEEESYESLINQDNNNNIISPNSSEPFKLDSPSLMSVNSDSKSSLDEDDFQNIDLLNDGNSNSPNILKRSFNTFKNLFKSNNKTSYSKLNDNNSSNGKIEIQNNTPTTNNVEKKQFKENKNSNKDYNENVFKNKLILATTFLYMIVGFIFTMHDESFPIWALAPIKHGGLAFSSNKVGICGAFGGVTVLLIQLLVIKRTVKRYGIIKVFMIGNILTSISFLCYPVMNLFVVRDDDNNKQIREVVFWIFVSSVVIGRQFAGQFVFTPIMTLINNSATNKLKGQANGLGQSLVALSRAIAPSFASITLAWSLTNGKPFPLNFFLVFIIMAVVSIIPAVACRYLPISLNAPIPENDEKEEEDAFNDSIENSKDDIVEIQDYDPDVVVLYSKDKNINYEDNDLTKINGVIIEEDDSMKNNDNYR